MAAGQDRSSGSSTTFRTSASRDVPGLLSVDRRCRTSPPAGPPGRPQSSRSVCHRPPPPTGSISMDYATHFETATLHIHNFPNGAVHAVQQVS